MGPMPNHVPFTPSTRGAPITDHSGYTKSGYDKSASGYTSGYGMASQQGYMMPPPRAVMNVETPRPPSSGYPAAGSLLAHPGSCRASGDGLYTAMARRAAHFTITSVDAAGNRRSEGGEPFVVSIRGPGAVTTSVRDCQDGTYSVGWVVSVRACIYSFLHIRARPAHAARCHACRLARAVPAAVPAAVPVAVPTLCSAALSSPAV